MAYSEDYSLTNTLLDPNSATQERKKAYDKILNLQPSTTAKQGLETSKLTQPSLRNVYQAAQMGGYSGRQAAGQEVDQTSMQLAALKGQHRAEQDAVSMTGAQAKENIMGARQQQGLAQFNRKTQDMEDAMDRAIAQRAFDLGMTAKEMSFHQNSKIADVGFEQLQKDFEAGRVSQQELEKLKGNLELAAQKSKQNVDNILREIERRSKSDIAQLDRDAAWALQIKLIEAQKDALKKQAKASNISAIIGGVTTISGGILGGVLSGGNPGGVMLGMSAGKGLGDVASGAAQQQGWY